MEKKVICLFFQYHEKLCVDQKNVFFFRKAKKCLQSERKINSVGLVQFWACQPDQQKSAFLQPSLARAQPGPNAGCESILAVRRPTNGRFIALAGVGETNRRPSFPISFSVSDMAEPPPSQSPAQTPPPPPQQQAPGAGGREDMMACVAALEAALLPCLPARELQAVDRSLQSSHQSTDPDPSFPPLLISTSRHLDPQGCGGGKSRGFLLGSWSHRPIADQVFVVLPTR